MWLGEQITARGIGNASVNNLLWNSCRPGALASTFELGRTGAISSGIIILILLLLLIAIILLFLLKSSKKVLIQYPKRQQGNKM